VSPRGTRTGRASGGRTARAAASTDPAASATTGLEAKVWQSADVLRNDMDAADDSKGAAVPGGLAYTPNQLRAIRTIDENLQIVACAGAGKTQVVAERVAEILERKRSEGIGPANIVAFTFTDRAGAELKDRILDRVHARLGEIPGMAEMYVGTIHGYCLNLLQTHLPEYFKYSVLNEVQARLLVDRSPRKAGMYELGLKRWLESRLFLEVLAVMREADVDYEQLRDHPVLAALDSYETVLDAKRHLDYTEIMVRAVAALFEHDDLRRRIGSQVRYLIVDEYQDVNPLQESLIGALAGLGANVCVVGDDDQTIYQWRGGNVENILGFTSRYEAVVTVPIEENYRSSAGVIDAAGAVIAHNDPDRLPKVMRSADSQSFDRGDVLCQTFTDPDEEARWIAKKAKSMLGTPFVDQPGAAPRGLAPSDITVLLRSVKNTAAPLVGALRAEGLPVVVVGMTGLFEQPEVTAAVAFFEFMVKRVSHAEVRKVWLDADLGLSTASLDSAIATAEAQREWDETQRWSVYNLQRSYLTFLEQLGIREETVPDGRGEVVYYNLGKFSQVISDYEQIHFHSDPQAKYEGFADFLHYQAPGYYPEGWQDAGYVRPDAVQVMTIHQAKGMEWPVVFIPCLQANRFPAKKGGGKSKWHVIPKAAVANADRYDGSTADERRLFYVALTRSKKYLFCSWAPDPGNQLYRRPSPFVGEISAHPDVLTREPERRPPTKLEPQPRREAQNLALSFSELKYFFECPYQFKLRFLYGFNPPIYEGLGYGKSLHDALAEVHKRALAGEKVTAADAEELVDRHLNVPFAFAELRDALRRAGVDAIRRYLQTQGHLLDKTEHVEQVVEINLGHGVVVNGRIDLIRRTDTKEIIVIDFKSTERAQEEDVTRTQLHIYALGYRELTGTPADLIEIYNLDKAGHTQREEVSAALEEDTKVRIREAGQALRANSLPRLSEWSKPCGQCDLSGICRTKATA
jgi:DNA helicase-2/ATP-dependent DNA helicase PcrA